MKRTRSLYSNHADVVAYNFRHNALNVFCNFLVEIDDLVVYRKFTSFDFFCLLFLLQMPLIFSILQQMKNLMQLIRCRLWYLYPLGVFFLAHPSTFEWRRLHSRISNTLRLRWFNLKQLKYLVKYFELNFLLYWLIDISKFIYESFTSIFRVDFKFF